MAAPVSVAQSREMPEVLATTLRALHGADARLLGWTAEPLTKRGRGRVVRCDVAARVSGVPGPERHSWVAKFFDSEVEAQRAATVLRALEVDAERDRETVVFPRVLACDAERRVVVLTLEAGESLTAAIARAPELVLPAIGTALAALHAAPITTDTTTSPGDLLKDLGPRVAALGRWLPHAAARVWDELAALGRDAPAAPAATSFLHGDLGPVQLLWSAGRVVMLDFDRCTLGDVALDLGGFLTQLRRLTLRKPGKLPAFTTMRSVILDAYARCTLPDPGLDGRVTWYERIVLLRKVHQLTFDTTRHPEVEAISRRQSEARDLLKEVVPPGRAAGLKRAS